METFDCEIQTDATHLQQAVKIVLQSICFHRLFGTIKPATYKAFGLTFPTVGEAEVDQLVQDKALLACHQLQTSATDRVELVVLFLHPSAGLDSKIGGSSPAAASASASGMATTAANAASSLRAWASPRNYPYSWLAHAFSGGAGQAGGGSTVPPVSPSHARTASADVSDIAAQEEYAALSAKAFEQWSICFILAPQSVASHELTRPSTRELTAYSMARFMDKLLTFVEQRKSHIPAITSADLCPFPLRILIR